MGKALSLFAAAVALCGSTAGRAQTPEAFYAGKTLTMVVGTAAGGGYDTYARLLARHLGRHLPGKPNVAVQNMPGGDGRRAGNYLFSAAPQDGLWIGTLEQNVPFTQAMERDNAFFDVRRFHYLGNMSTSVSTIVAWHTSGVRSLEDAKTRDLVIGATGTTGTNKIFPTLLNEIAGTRFKIVSGYKGGADLDLAMERGEIGGRGSVTWTTLKATRPDWIADRKVAILVQIGLHKSADLPNAPLLDELARNEDDRQVIRLISSGVDLGRIVLTTPNVPESRVAALRAAFDAAVRDPQLLADAARSGLDINPASGVEVQDIVAAIMATPAAIIERTRHYLD